ncbi:MAG TPA: hypothetical protein VFD66_01710, partial [Verrucomicrobiae bacterium]|nr:hypothetical protein [Verrucomicrobiae bacterium]
MKQHLVNLPVLLAAAPKELRRESKSRIIAIAIAMMACVLAAPVSFAGSVAAPYEVGRWDGFRPAAISYTFDD